MGGDRPPLLDWGQKNFIARPKNTHICKPPACQNVLKLTYSNLEFQNFPGEDPRPPSSRGGKGKGGEEEGKGKGRTEGKDRGGTGREGGRVGMGRGGEGHSTWALPP